MTAAIEFARVMDAELHGLFVEDTELLALATLPFAGEVGFPSADSPGARRRRDGTRAPRAGAADSAGPHGTLAGQPVKWTFEVVRGRIVAELVATAEERDLADHRGTCSRCRHGRLGGANRARLREAVGPPAARRRIAPGPGLDRGRPGRHAPPRQTSPRFSLRSRRSTVAWCTSSWSTRSCRFGNRGKREMRILLGEHGISGHFRIAANEFPRELDRLIADERPQLVVTLAATRESRDTLLDALPYPLLVLPNREARRAA